MSRALCSCTDTPASHQSGVGSKLQCLACARPRRQLARRCGPCLQHCVAMIAAATPAATRQRAHAPGKMGTSRRAATPGVECRGADRPTGVACLDITCPGHSMQQARIAVLWMPAAPRAPMSRRVRQVHRVAVTLASAASGETRGLVPCCFDMHGRHTEPRHNCNGRSAGHRVVAPLCHVAPRVTAFTHLQLGLHHDRDRIVNFAWHCALPSRRVCITVHTTRAPRLIVRRARLQTPRPVG